MFTTTPLLPDTIQLFDLYCDINDIVIEHSSDIVQAIITQQHNKIITYHRYGFLFYYLDQFVRGEITHEQFITMGDIEGQIDDQINPHIYREEYPIYLTTLTPELVTQWKSDDLVVIDQLLYDYYLSKFGPLLTSAKFLILK